MNLNGMGQLSARLWSALDRQLNAETIHFVCLVVVTFAVIFTAYSFQAEDPSRTIFGAPLGADFAGFYIAGHIWNDYGPSRLYDWNLQAEVYHQLFPSTPADEKLPYVHPPMVAFVFRIFAWLPYRWAVAVWLTVSLCMCLTGCWILVGSLEGQSAQDRATIMLIAVSFQPFIIECWIGGQLSAVALCCFAIATRQIRSGRTFAAGAVVAILLYKPTLLVLILPMFAAARVYSALFGFTLTGLLIGALTIAIAGVDCCRAFLQKLFGFAEEVSGGDLQLRIWKYVDLNTFSRILLDGPSFWQRLLFLSMFAGLFAFMMRRWLTWPRASPQQRDLLWAATVSGTPILNYYVGVYDSILCVVACSLTTNVWRKATLPLPGDLRLLFVAGYLAPWFTQSSARNFHVQIYSVVLAAMMLWPLFRRPSEVVRPAHPS